MEFTPQSVNPNGKQFRCEIGDLLVVNYSVEDDSPLIRLTFLQAKVADRYDRMKSPLPQWALLSQRPAIKAVNQHINIPYDILSNALFPSITSYGFFYQDLASSGWDFDFIQAQYLEPLKPIGKIIKNRSRTFYSTTYDQWTKRYSYKHDREMMDMKRSSNLLAFGYGLENCGIGSPIDLRPSHFDTNTLRITEWLASILRSEISPTSIEEWEPNEHRASLIREVLEFLPTETPLPKESLWRPNGIILVRGTPPDFELIEEIDYEY